MSNSQVFLGSVTPKMFGESCSHPPMRKVRPGVCHWSHVSQLQDCRDYYGRPYCGRITNHIPNVHQKFATAWTSDCGLSYRRKPSLFLWTCPLNPLNPLNVPSFLQTDCILWPSRITFGHSQEVNPRSTGVKQAQRGRDQRPYHFNTRVLLTYVDMGQPNGAMEYQLIPISWVTQPI